MCSIHCLVEEIKLYISIYIVNSVSVVRILYDCDSSRMAVYLFFMYLCISKSIIMVNMWNECVCFLNEQSHIMLQYHSLF